MKEYFENTDKKFEILT